MRPDILEIDTAMAARLAQNPISLADGEAIRLILSGGSVVDWQRAAFASLDDVDRFLHLQRLDMTDPDDRLRLRYVYNEAVSYLEEHLRLRFPAELRDPADVRNIFVMASETGAFRRTQILSCVILKLLHVIHHMEAADLKFRTPIPEARFFEMAHEQIMAASRRMREAGLPVVSFYGSRKSRSSVITKLLAKRESVAATVFDKLRFRIVVERRGDLVPLLAWITREMVPFNYAIPAQSHNNLLDPGELASWLPHDDPEPEVPIQDDPTIELTGKNEFSSASYRMINFIVDFPVRIPDTDPHAFTFELGRVVFVMVEFQILDQETATANEEGENAHTLYKDRQHRVVARRLKRGAAIRRGPVR